MYPSELCMQVSALVREAGKLMDKPQVITSKGGFSNYVTDCDKTIQDFLSERLLKLLPGSCMLGEESNAWEIHGEDIWIADPIDGTSNFIRDLGASVISVGLMRKNHLAVGAIYNPFRDELFYAEQGCGAYLNGTQIHVSDKDFSHSLLFSAMSVYDKRHAPACMNIISRVYEDCDDFRRFGAAAFETAQIAAGRGELYFEMRIAPWDAAAGALLIEEAGGYWECLYHDGFCTNRLFPFIAANTKENFDRLREIVTSEVPVIPYDEPLF